MARPALAATRAISMLNFLASRPSEQFALSDIAHALQINLASTHAILAALQDSGYVVRHPRLRTYSLGPSVVALGSAALECHPAIDQARDEARRLSGELGLGVAVTAIAGDDIVFLARFGPHGPRDIEAHVGLRIPAVPPKGAIFVAWHDPGAWLAKASEREAMEVVLEEVRSRGWAAALDSTSEYTVLGQLQPDAIYDVMMVTAPVFGPAGDALVALTLLGLPPALSSNSLIDFGEHVRDAGLVATRRIGGRAPSLLSSRVSS